MNILVLCLSEGKGGLEFYIARMAQYLNPPEFNLHFCIKHSSPLDNLLKKTVQQKTYLDKRITYLPLYSAVKLAGIIDRLAIDCIFINWGADLPLAAMAKAFAKRKPKLVYSRHMKITRPKRDVYHRWIYGQVDLFLTITEQLRAEVLRFLPLNESQVKNCYLGVAKPVQQHVDCQQALQSLGVPADSFPVALFGRIEHGKGQHILIEAMRVLKQKNVILHAAIIGHVMNHEYYHQLCKSIREADLEQQVHMIGFIDQPMSIMPCFKIVVLTTYEETFGLVLAEAMRCGVGVIGTNAGGVTEIIEDGISGLMFEPGNAQELADCLQALVEDSNKLDRLAKTGQERADRLFDEAKHFEQLAQELVNI